MLKNKLQNREGDVRCQPLRHSHRKTVRFLLILFGVSLLIGITVSSAQAQAGCPVAVNDDDSTSSETPTLIDVLANDTGEIDPTTVTIVTQPLHGSVNVDQTEGDVTYTPNPGFSGVDNFKYTVADEEGCVSNEAVVEIVVNDPPEIIDFESFPGYGDAWTFTGCVEDDQDPGGLTITFGGLLEGHSTTTDEDGCFSYTVVLTEVGIVTAQTTDELGEESDVEEVFVEEF